MNIRYGFLSAILFFCLSSGPAFAADLVRAPRNAGEKMRKTEYRLKQNYPAPLPAAPEKYQQLPAAGVPHNIILIIGDGMGAGALRLASLHAHGAPGKLVMEQLPAAGLVRTVSANSNVTDSAAAATALSSGTKTDNGVVGMTSGFAVCRSIAEAAAASGRSVGILTTDSLTGATPSAFYAHVKNRKMEPEIAAQTLLCGFELLIGNETKKPFLPKSNGGGRSDGRDLCAELTAKGYAAVGSERELSAVPRDRKVFGFVSFPIHDPAVLSRFAGEAMERLNANPKGFFLLVECSNPDWGGHRNDPDQSVAGVLMTDFVVRRALAFAEQHGNTLLVVTADHETGGIAAAPNRRDPKTPHLSYGSAGHTGTPVEVFAAGPGSAFFNGVIENTQIPRRFAELWKLNIGSGADGSASSGNEG